MADPDVDVALQRIEKDYPCSDVKGTFVTYFRNYLLNHVIGDELDIVETEMTIYYDQCAQTYELDVANLNYATPRAIAEAASNLALDDQKRTWNILDLASGLVGEALRKSGFSGELTALDCSKNMLQAAMNKPGLNNAGILHTLTVDSPVPLPDSTFDLIACGGGFGKDAITAKCFQEVIRLLKVGGFFIKSSRISDQLKEFHKEFEEELRHLETSQRVKVVASDMYSQYHWNTSVEGNTGIVPGKLDVYQKL
ncbi:methyltransferase-like protein 27 isoform X2 [Clavelina lepadiformis]|uniref:methyltransferase-like protein 27 isoform X2 n=1 Tax=Clavelina lepadiformis TaxID=159417 RepID=UPI004042DA6E